MAEELIFPSKEELLAFLKTIDNETVVKITVEEAKQGNKGEGLTDG